MILRRRRPRGARRSILIVAAVAAVFAMLVGSGSGALPSGFQETTVFTGLTNPTAIEFASDGRVFVAEKRGVIKVFDNLSDTTPAVFADLNTNVYNFWDRGLLGMVLDPDFPASPSVYVLYTARRRVGARAESTRTRARLHRARRPTDVWSPGGFRASRRAATR